jgi:nitrite reductase/ring-hydroxylating ferredoxin subunit
MSDFKIGVHNHTIQRCECGSKHYDIDNGKVVCYDCGNVPTELRAVRHYLPNEFVDINVMDGHHQVHYQRLLVSDCKEEQ